jgi:ribulose-phosphate 3-epimerase
MQAKKPHKPIIVPTVTAYDTHEYRSQMQRIEGFASRVHIDLMDGDFAPTISPTLDHVWWHHHLKADIHLMYRKPMDYIDELIKLKPHMVVIHNEADVHHMHFAAQLHEHGIKTGLAVLSDTPVEWAHQIMHSFDQVLIFSGKLGHHGGTADMTLLDKVKYLKSHHQGVEIAWDGGINADNARQLVDAGVTVLNTGGYIQKAEHAKDAYATINTVINRK